MQPAPSGEKACLPAPTPSAAPIPVILKILGNYWGANDQSQVPGQQQQDTVRNF